MTDASATYIVAGSTGPVGPQGPQGERGLQGDQGNRGATGPIGPRGGAGTIAVGSTTTLPATGTDLDTLATATVTNVGISGSEAILNFGIPSGVRGPKGDPGTFSANSSDTTVGTTFSIDASNGNTFIAGTLDVSKNVSFFSDLDVSGNVDVSGNLVVDGSFTLSNGTDSDVNSGALVITGGLYVGKKIYGGRKLTVATEGIDVLSGGITMTSGNLTMSSGNLDVTGSSTLRGNTSVTDANTLTVGTGATNLGGSLTVTGDASFNAGLTVNSDALDNALKVDSTSGVTTIGNNLVANGDVILGGGSGNTITAGGRFSSDLIPSANATYDLGSATLGWNDLHLGSGGVINFGNSNLNITHSNRRLTLSSGSTFAAKAISATSIDSSGNITVPANSLVSFNGNIDTNQAIYGDNSYLYLRSGGVSFRVPNNITTDYFLKTDANGNLSWELPAGGSSNSSTNASKFFVTNDTTDTEGYPVFVNSSNGNQSGKVDSGKLKYNASTGAITAILFNGNVNGDLSGNATFATDISGGSIGQIPYQTGSSATAFSSGLTFNGSNTLTVTNLSGNASSATTATHIANGTANQIPFQTGSGTTTFSSDLTFNDSTNTLSAPNFDVTSNTPNISATGTNANIDLNLIAKGTGNINFTTNSNTGTLTFSAASKTLTVSDSITLDGGSKTLTLNENLTIGDGTDITITGVGQANTLTLNEGFTIGDGHTGTLTFSAASKTLTVSDSIILDGGSNTLTLGSDLTTSGTNTTITGVTQANTLTLNEGFTIGGGHTGTLTFSAASKTLTVSENCTIDQNLASNQSVAFNKLSIPNTTATTTDVVSITGDTLTTGNAVNISATSLTTGSALKITGTANKTALNVASGHINIANGGIISSAATIFSAGGNRTITATELISGFTYIGSGNGNSDTLTFPNATNVQSALSPIGITSAAGMKMPTVYATANSSHSLTIKDSAGTSIGTVAAGEGAAIDFLFTSTTTVVIIIH